MGGRALFFLPNAFPELGLLTPPFPKFLNQTGFSPEIMRLSFIISVLSKEPCLCSRNIDSGWTTSRDPFVKAECDFVDIPDAFGFNPQVDKL